MLPQSASLSCHCGVREVGTCTPVLRRGAEMEHRLSAGHWLAVQRPIFTGELSLESAECIKEFENSSWPLLQRFLSSNVACFVIITKPVPASKHCSVCEELMETS